MQLHNLSKLHKKRAQRVGRGGKRGTTSGRGQKGQKSRSGRRIRPAERDLIIRIPKKRGFRNKPKSEDVAIFNLDDLSKFLKLNPSVKDLNRSTLVAWGLLKKRFSGDIKVLGSGGMGVPVRVEGIKVSKSAKEKIVKAGGEIVN